MKLNFNKLEELLYELKRQNHSEGFFLVAKWKYLMNEYQRKALETAVYPGSGSIAGLTYTTLGLVGEAGEIANKVKKFHRGDKVMTDESREQLAKELGDVLWYVATTAEELGYNLADIAEMNIEKLQSRQDRGQIKGDGDNR